MIFPSIKPATKSCWLYRRENLSIYIIMFKFCLWKINSIGIFYSFKQKIHK